MASLRETSIYAKKIIKFSAIGLVVFLIFKLSFGIVKKIWLQYHPPAPPPPTVDFGKLSPIKFPEDKKISGLNFELETPSGELPEFPVQIEVYQFVSPQAKLLAVEKAQQQAEEFGFKTEPQKLSSTIFQWKKQDPLSSVLEINILTKDFSLEYDWQEQAQLFKQKNPPNQEQAVQFVKSFLSARDLLHQDLKQGVVNSSFSKIKQTETVSAVSLSEAHFIELEFFRKDINELPVLTPDIKKGIVSAVVSGVEGMDKIVSLDYNFFEIDYSREPTYPIKSGDVVWEELKQDKAFIVNWSGEKDIVIRRVFLAYFDSWEYPVYLQPVFVFQGDSDFIAYLPAVEDDWIE